MRKTKRYLNVVHFFALSTLLFTLLSPAVVFSESATPVYEWTAYLDTVAGLGADITDIETAPDGSVYAVGDLFGTVDFDPTGAGDAIASAGSTDVFVTKRGSDGSYQWTRVIGDPSSQSTGYFPDVITKVDAAGNIYLWGGFRGTVNFDPTGSDVRSALSNSDDFVTKWNADGSYGWTHTFGAPAVPSPNYDSITAIEVSASGDAYVGGDFSGPTDFNAYGAGDIKTAVGGGSDRDAYVTKINSDGSYGWTQTFGGTANDYISTNNLLLAGDGSGLFAPVTFQSPSIDADPGVGTTTLNQIGCCDMMGLIKLDFSGNLLWAYEFGNNAYVDIDNMTTDTAGAIYAQGQFGNTLDFDPGVGTELVTASGSSGAFVLKLNQDGSYNWSSQFVGVGENNGIELGNEGIYNSITLNNGSDWTIDGNLIPGTSSWDTFVTKWDFDGNYQWTRTLGTAEYDYGYDFSVNANCDAVYVLGDVYPLVTGTIPFDQFGSDDRTVPDTGAFYITRYSTNGQYTWSNVIDSAVDSFYIDNTAVGPGDSLYFAGEAEGSAINFDDTGGTDVINTGGNSAGVISKISSSSYRQHVLNLGGTINALESGSGDNAKIGNLGVSRTGNTGIQVENASNNLAVAEIDADLSCDRDWAGVDLDSDASAGTAYVTNLIAAEGTAASLDLYVPELVASTGVGICPGAASLGVLSNTCSGYYELSSGDAGLASTTIGAQNYWQVLGITDAGAFNLAAETVLDPTPDTTTIDTEVLAETGDSPLKSIVIGLLLAGVAYRAARPRVYRSF